MSHTLELGLVTLLLGAFTLQTAPDRQRLLNPSDPAFTERAADRLVVTLETTKGTVVVEVIRAWAPLGADRFVNLVRHGYYDDAMIFRIRPATWAQFGIAGDPRVAQAWRHATFPDDPFRESNVRGTVPSPLRSRMDGPRRCSSICGTTRPRTTRSRSCRSAA